MPKTRWGAAARAAPVAAVPFPGGYAIGRDAALRDDARAVSAS